MLVTASPIWAGLATAYQDGTHFYVENDVLKIAVLRTTGNLDGLIHKQSGVNLQTRTGNNFPAIWGMSLSTPAGGSLFTQSSNAIAFSGSVSTTATGAVLDLTWTGQQYLGAGVPNIPGLTVHAQISVRAGSQLSYWTLQTSGLGPNTIASINFPAVAGIGPLGQSGQDDLLLTSEFKGTLYHNPTANVPAGSNPGGSYPSAAGLVQMLAFFDPTSGFYFATDDTGGNTKQFNWGKSASPAGDNTINMIFFPAGHPDGSLSVPYNIIVGATQGDWYAPAEIYRSWAVQQQWTQQSRTKPVPTWLHDLPVIRNTCAHGCGSQPDQPYANVVQELQASQQALEVPALGQLWGWEQFGSWAFGDYFPPQEGAASFAAMIRALPGGLYVFPSALFLDTATKLFKSGTMTASAMLDQSGNPRTTPGAAALPADTWAYMDFSTEPWRSYTVGVYQNLAQSGVNLIQFDSSMVLGPQPCYNPAHAHPPGDGGNWQTLAWIDLAQRTATAMRTVNPNAALAAENPAEVYLPYFAVHSSSALDQFEQDAEYAAYKELVPLYQYVYHDSILFDDFIGPPANPDGSFFRLALARDLTWGQIPDYQIPVGYTPALESMAEAYLKNDIAARTSYAKKFLVDGIMLPAPPLSVPPTTVTWITNFTNGATASNIYPSIMESAWRASDGSIGVIMTNITTGNLTFNLPVAFSRLGLIPGSAYRVQSTDGLTTVTLDSNLVKDSSYSITVRPQQVLLVQLTPTAPKPLIGAGGVVSHAGTSGTVSPGSLIDIYGTNLASTAVTAPAGVLPTLLGTTQVQINGIPAPLIYAGPTQIVAQVPGSVVVGPASVAVLVGGAASAIAGVNVQSSAPNILTYGSNRAIVQNQDYSLNAPANPASAGSAAVVYLVGSGPVEPTVADGFAAEASPLSRESLPTTVTVGGNPAQVFYAGLAPGFVGLVQVNFYVPDLPPGDYPIQISIGPAQSNAPIMSVGK